jgi:hypothetical protein
MTTKIEYLEGAERQIERDILIEEGSFGGVVG